MRFYIWSRDISIARIKDRCSHSLNILIQTLYWTFKPHRDNETTKLECLYIRELLWKSIRYIRAIASRGRIKIIIGRLPSTVENSKFQTVPNDGPVVRSRDCDKWIPRFLARESCSSSPPLIETSQREITRDYDAAVDSL